MSSIKLSPEQREALLPAIKGYCADELDLELGGFEAEFLLDFFIDQIGPTIYNRALQDAQAALAGRLELLGELFYELEK